MEALRHSMEVDWAFGVSEVLFAKPGDLVGSNRPILNPQAIHICGHFSQCYSRPVENPTFLLQDRTQKRIRFEQKKYKRHQV